MIKGDDDQGSYFFALSSSCCYINNANTSAITGSQSSLSYEYILTDLVNYNRDKKLQKSLFIITELLQQLNNSNKPKFFFEMFIV